MRSVLSLTVLRDLKLTFDLRTYTCAYGTSIDLKNL